MSELNTEQARAPIQLPPFRFEEISFDSEVEIAASIYDGSPQEVINRACILSAEATAELQRFSQEYAAFLGVEWQPYMRMDIYPTPGGLAVLEVNTAFVDGWGTALNLSRAAGQRLLTDGVFPNRFEYQERQYKPELALLLGELAVNGQTETSMRPWGNDNESPEEPTYVYGRTLIEAETILPRAGLRLDDKRNLARFGRQWSSPLVQLPEVYAAADGVAWEDIPSEVYLKFVDKSSEESQAARFSVQRGKPQGKARFLRNAYAAGSLIAQAEIPAWRETIERGAPYAAFEAATQIVVLAKGDFLAGYVQYGRGQIINDNSVHGPLFFEQTEQEAM